MTEEVLQPNNLNELQEIIKGSERKLLPRGGGSKPALSRPPEEAQTLDLSSLSGIIKYTPGEFTFTALSGTPVKDIESALQEHSQYLPFDPLYVFAGATLGGTVAANANGPGRYRYGGVRDFILGVQFVNGDGHLINSGGKVVKNAAGFDLPKLMVGSRGGLAAFFAITFKVFPKPEAYTTLNITTGSIDQALEKMLLAANSHLDPHALEIDVKDGAYTLLVRLGSLRKALAERIERLQRTLGAGWNYLSDEKEQIIWQSAREMEWASSHLTLMKIPITPGRMIQYENALRLLEEKVSKAQNSRCKILRHYSAGGQVAWLAFEPQLTYEIENLLLANDLSGLVIRWSSTHHDVPHSPQLGKTKGEMLMRRVKTALDPSYRFWETFT